MSLPPRGAPGSQLPKRTLAGEKRSAFSFNNGMITLAGAVPIESLAGGDSATRPGRIAEAMVPPAALLQGLPSVCLTLEGLDWVAHGRDLAPVQWRQTAIDRKIPWPDGPESWVRLLDEAGHLVALATRRPASPLLHPSIVLI